jgi:hypothetical protein
MAVHSDVTDMVSRSPIGDFSEDEFFSGRSPAKGLPRGYQRAAAWIRMTRAPASPDELASEDQVAAAFIDASGSIWTRHQTQMGTRSKRSATFLSFLNREGQHIRRASPLGVEVDYN